MPGARARRRQEANYWPGFVDALSSLLLVIIFMLSLFMLTQFFLGQEIQGRDTALARLNSQIAELTDLLQLERANSDDLTAQLATLTATLAGAQAENDSLASQLEGIGTGLGDRDATIAGLESDLLEAQQLSDEANAQVTLLNQQLAALRTQIAALESALEASESRDAESRTQIADLGRRLNLALAQRVQDLSRYRSDFFGRLRQILEDRADVRVVGDRFVFQSEVLFDPGQADIDPAGTPELDALADAILQPKVRPTSTGCCASTATPIAVPFPMPASPPTGNSRRPARFRSPSISSPRGSRPIASWRPVLASSPRSTRPRPKKPIAATAASNSSSPKGDVRPALRVKLVR